MSIDIFRKWKHAFMKYVDNIRSWRRGSHILEGTRVHASKIDAAQMELVMKKINETEAGTIVSGIDWVQNAGGSYGDIFQIKAGEPNICYSTKTASRAVRPLSADGIGERLRLVEIDQQGQRSSTTRAGVLHGHRPAEDVETKVTEYRSVIGSPPNHENLGKSLRAMAHLDTQEKAEGVEKLNFVDYDEFRMHLLDKQEKLVGRQGVRPSHSHNRMVDAVQTGVGSAPIPEAACAPAARRQTRGPEAKEQIHGQ